MGGSLPKLGRLDPAGPSARPAPRATPSFGELDFTDVNAELELEVGRGSRDRRTERPGANAPMFGEPDAEDSGGGSLGADAEPDREVSRTRRIADLPFGSFEASLDSLELETARDSGNAVTMPPSEIRVVAAAIQLDPDEADEGLLALVSALAAEPAGEDPFGGLILVEDDAPLGGIELVEEPAEEDEDEDDFDNGDFDRYAAEAKRPPPVAQEVSRVGVLPARRIPRMLVGPGEISKLPIDPRTAFLLGHIDGLSTVEEIIDMCAMPEAETLELIERLHAMGVIDDR